VDRSTADWWTYTLACASVLVRERVEDRFR
jgi:hypothetical protein